MRSKSLLPLALMLAASAVAELPPAPPARATREPQPRKFTDARKADAQAKRDRKAARRARERKA